MQYSTYTRMYLRRTSPASCDNMLNKLSDQTMDSSKVESVIKKLNISLDLWKVEVRAGQILLKDILTNLYPAEKEREPLPADDSLQQACEGLAGVLRELQEVVDDVEVVRSRLAALSNLVGEGDCIEMNNNTVNVRELRDWVINLHLEFKAQVNSTLLH